MPENPAVLVGSSTADDAGVVRLSDDLAIVQTIDFFPPMVDDPTWFGRVGAANAISDVYAMGGVPVSAVAVYGLPADLPTWVPPAILNGAIDVLNECETPLVGGHTVKDKEIKFGLCVTGTVHPDRIVTNSDAKAGDKLVLTKPLGSGYLCTAIKNESIAPEHAEQVMRIMATVNAAGAKAMVEVGVNAATDITGFGVLGHAISMADASGVTIRLDAAAAPWIDGLAGYIAPKNTCGGLNRNLAYANDHATFEGGTDEQVGVLADPQTSGGLMISVAGEKLDALLSALEAHGVETRAVIGDVVEKGETPVTVV